MMHKRLLILFILFSGIISPTYSQPLVLSPIAGKEDFGDKVQLLRDHQQKITIDNIASLSVRDQFMDSTSKTVTLTPGVNVWLYFELYASSFEEWWLEFGNSEIIDQIQIYQRLENDWQEQIYSSQHSVESRPVVFHEYIIPLRVTSTVSPTWIKITPRGSGEIKPSVWFPTQFMNEKQPQLLLSGLFYGVGIVFVCYHLFWLIQRKSADHLYFVSYVLGTLGSFLVMDGIGYTYLWSNFPRFNVLISPIFVLLLILGLVFYSISILELKQSRPSLVWKIRVLLSLATISLLLPLFVELGEIKTVIYLFQGLWVPFLLLLGMVAYRKQVTGTGYYILGFFISIVFSMPILLSAFYEYPFPFSPITSFWLASLGETFFFSLALWRKSQPK